MKKPKNIKSSRQNFSHEGYRESALFDKQVQNIELIKKKAIDFDNSKILFNNKKNL